MNLLFAPTASMHTRMGDEWRKTFREVLDSITVADFARATGRPYRTVQDWRRGLRNPPPEALTDLVAFLRSRSQAYAAAAQRLETVAPDSGKENPDE